MKKIILTLAAVSALTAAASAASAQPGRNDRDFRYDRDFGRPPIAAPGVGIDARQAMIAQRIDNGRRNGAISRREAMRLNAELREIDRTEAAFRRSRPGLTQVEIAQLNVRLDRLAAQVRVDRNDREFGYGYGYGRR
jgi:opacity protein-like surface antigen